MEITICPGKAPRRAAVPLSKSEGHRALILAAMATVGLAAGFAPAALAAPRSDVATASRTPTEAENARIVTAFYDLAFNRHRPTEAARLYIGDRYIQHTPRVPNGAAAFAAKLGQALKRR